MNQSIWYEVVVVPTRTNGYSIGMSSDEAKMRAKYASYINGIRSVRFAFPMNMDVDVKDHHALLDGFVEYKLVKKIYRDFDKTTETQCVAAGYLQNQQWWKDWQEKREARKTRSPEEIAAEDARKAAKKARKAADSLQQVVVEREMRAAKITSAKDRKAYEVKVEEARKDANAAAEKARIAEEEADRKERIAKP